MKKSLLILIALACGALAQTPVGDLKVNANTGAIVGPVSAATFKSANSISAGTGTVTSVSVTTANGVSGSVATATTTPAITLTLGVIVPTSVNGITLSGGTNTFTLTLGTASLTVPAGVSGTLGTAAFTASTAYDASGAAAAAQAASQPLSASLTSWSAITRASGFDTLTATPSSANLRALLTDELGTGAALFDGATPTGLVLTNATGLPISSGVSGLGTGNATALGAAVNTTGGFCTSTNGKLSSVRILDNLYDTNGNGILYFVATTNAANSLRITNSISGAAPSLLATGGDSNIDLTISGKGSGIVRMTSPALTTPDLGTPTAIVLTNATGTAASLTAGNVTTNANLTGDVTSVGNATTLAAGTSSGGNGSTDNTKLALFGSGGKFTLTNTLAIKGASLQPGAVKLWNTANTFSTTFDADNGTGATADHFIYYPDATTSLLNSGYCHTISGPTAARTFTFPDSSSTMLYSGGALGTPSSGTATNLTGTAASLTAGNATKWTTGRTVALTGDVTYTSGSLDGSGSVTGTATLSAGSASNLNSGTLAAARGGTGVSNTGTITLAGNLVTTGAFNTTFAQTATTTITAPSTNSTMARSDAAQTFTGLQTFTNAITVGVGSDSTTTRQAITTLNAGYAVPSANNSTSNGDKYVFYNSASGKFATGLDTAYGWWFQAIGTAPYFYFVTGTATGAGTERMRIDNSTVTITDALSVSGNVTQTAKTTTYNNIATVSNGVPAEYATVDLTAQSAAKTTTTLYTPAATGMFRVSVYLQVTTAASTSSVLGGATGVVLTYNDGDGNVAQSDTMALMNSAGAIAISSATNTTGTNLSGSMVIYARTGVAISYAVDYTSVGVTPMQFAAHLKIEAL